MNAAERFIRGPEEVYVVPALFVIASVVLVLSCSVLGILLGSPCFGVAAALLGPPLVGVGISMLNVGWRVALRTIRSAMVAGTRVVRGIALAVLGASALLWIVPRGASLKDLAIGMSAVVLALCHEFTWHHHVASRLIGSTAGIQSVVVFTSRWWCSLPIVVYGLAKTLGRSELPGGVAASLPLLLLHAILFSTLYEWTRSVLLLAAIDVFCVALLCDNVLVSEAAIAGVLAGVALVTVVAALMRSRSLRAASLDPSRFEDTTRALGVPVLDATVLILLAQPLAWIVVIVLGASVLVVALVARRHPGRFLSAVKTGTGTATATLVRSLRTGFRGRFRILFFRSFHEPYATRSTKLVAPILAQFGHLTMLTDRSFEEYAPPKGRFQIFDPDWARDVTGVVHPAESDWQASVRNLLRECDFVVLDVSRPSESLAWELNETRSTLPESRILQVADARTGRTDVDAHFGASRFKFLWQLLPIMRKVAAESGDLSVATDLQLRSNGDSASRPA